MSKPYVGVTGAVSETEVGKIINFFERSGLDMQGPRVPMNGTLVSYKTLDLGKHPENRRYPPLTEIPKILEATENKTFNTIHFNTKRPEKLSDDLSTVFNLENIYDRGYCHGVQFNVAWPPLEEIDKIRSVYPEIKMILQLSSKATKDMSIEYIVMKTKDYDTADYVLIDPSGGQGKDFNILHSSSLYKSLREVGVNATIGFAGGLSGENAEKMIKDLKIATGNDMFSVDAEGKLRDKRSEKYGDDDMNMKKVGSYIEAVLKGFFLK